MRGCTRGKTRGPSWMCCLAANKRAHMWEIQHEWRLREGPSGEKHWRENKAAHLCFSSFLKGWWCGPPSFHFCQTDFITWSCRASDKESVLEHTEEVVCSVSPAWSCCQGVSGCLMTGTLILKSNMTDPMPGQVLVALSYSVGQFTN